MSTSIYSRISSRGGHKARRMLFCRKCKAHGVQILLKDHVAQCPFNDCTCEKCAHVMSQRAKSIIRRYRTLPATTGRLVLKPVRFTNGNVRLRVFPQHIIEGNGECIPFVEESTESASHTNQAHKFTETGRCSSDADHSDERTTIPFCLDNAPVLPQYEYSSAERSPIGSLPALSPPSFHWLGSDLLQMLGTTSQVECPAPKLSIPPSAIGQFVGEEAHSNGGSLPSMLNSITSELSIRENAVARKLLNNLANSTSLPESHSAPVPVFLGERFSSRLLLSLDGDRSHPLFWQFINVVQQLEYAMLDPTSVR